MCVWCCPDDGSEPARWDECWLSRSQAVSERQPFHPGHRQVSEHQLQGGEGAAYTQDVESVTTYHSTKQTNKQTWSKLGVVLIKACGVLQELEAIRDALTPPLACAAAKIGDLEAMEALKEMVSNPTIFATRAVDDHHLVLIVCQEYNNPFVHTPWDLYVLLYMEMSYPVSCFSVSSPKSHGSIWSGLSHRLCCVGSTHPSERLTPEGSPANFQGHSSSMERYGKRTGAQPNKTWGLTGKTGLELPRRSRVHVCMWLGWCAVAARITPPVSKDTFKVLSS